jgi:hypothetical protein
VETKDMRNKSKLECYGIAEVELDDYDPVTSLEIYAAVRRLVTKTHTWRVEGLPASQSFSFSWYGGDSPHCCGFPLTYEFNVRGGITKSQIQAFLSYLERMHSKLARSLGYGGVQPKRIKISMRLELETPEIHNEQ